MKSKISIIGGGTAGLFCACFLDPDRFDIHIYEKNKSFARKFLVAGDGGFNLTHNEDLATFVERYTPSDFLNPALHDFTNKDFIRWLNNLGIETFVGSSKKIFPVKGIKPIHVLNRIIDHLKDRNVHFHFEEEFLHWSNDKAVLASGQEISSDYFIYAFGGASWKVTGSNGSWLNAYKERDIKTKSFQASNCAYAVEWNENFITKHEGNPIKNTITKCDQKQQTGELVVTKFGLEGNGIYGLSPAIRAGLEAKGSSIIYLDLKPTLSLEEIKKRLQQTDLNTTQILKSKIKLEAIKIDLIKSYLDKDSFLDIDILAEKIKKFPLELKESSPLDEGISTTGGIDLSEVDQHYELIKMPNHFVIGEMLDWDAPTGGYLIQACVSMAYRLAKHLNN